MKHERIPYVRFKFRLSAYRITDLALSLQELMRKESGRGRIFPQEFLACR